MGKKMEGIRYAQCTTGYGSLRRPDYDMHFYISIHKFLSVFYCKMPLVTKFEYTWSLAISFS